MPNYDVQRVRSMLPPQVKNVDELMIHILWAHARSKSPIKTTDDFISWITTNSERCMKVLTPYRANDSHAVRVDRNGLPALF